MVVLSNRAMGPSAELIVSEAVAGEMLRAIASAAHELGRARWEIELAAWLADSAGEVRGLDVSDIAWTPEHFELQRRFVVDAIARAAIGSQHASAFERWRRMIDSHPRSAVHVGRRWKSVARTDFGLGALERS